MVTSPLVFLECVRSDGIREYFVSIDEPSALKDTKDGTYFGGEKYVHHDFVSSGLVAKKMGGALKFALSHFRDDGAKKTFLIGLNAS